MHVAKLFDEIASIVSGTQIQEVYDQQKWTEDWSFTWSEFEQIASRCGCDLFVNMFPNVPPL